MFSVYDLFCHLSSVLFLSGFAGMSQNAYNFVFAQDEVVLILQLDFGAGILSKKYPVAFLHFQRHDRTVLERLARSNRDDLAFLRLFLRSVGNNDSALHCLLLLNTLNQNSIM